MNDTLAQGGQDFGVFAQLQEYGPVGLAAALFLHQHGHNPIII